MRSSHSRVRNNLLPSPPHSATFPSQPHLYPLDTLQGSTDGYTYVADNTYVYPSVDGIVNANVNGNGGDKTTITPEITPPRPDTILAIGDQVAQVGEELITPPFSSDSSGSDFLPPVDDVSVYKVLGLESRNV